MKAAFQLFDKDGSGAISANEVKEILMGHGGETGQKIDDSVWIEIIKEVDLDGNGEIDFKEFSVMMQKLIIEGESTSATTVGGDTGAVITENKVNYSQ